MALEVYNLDHVVTMTVMKSELQSCPFLFSLKKRESIDFSEILTRAEKYMHTEEAYEVHDPPPSPIIRE